MTDKKDFYALSEAAAMIGCNEEILRRLLQSGEVAGCKRLNKWYVLHSDIVAYIAGGKVAAPPLAGTKEKKPKKAKE